MAGRDKQFDQELALKSALDVFWAKGYEATSMQELVDAMQVNRASMYKTFGNKKELFNAAIDEYMQSSYRLMEDFLNTEDVTLDDLKALIGQLVRSNNMSGCLVGNSAAELGPHDPVIAQKIRTFWDKMESLFARSLDSALNKGEINTQLDTDKLAAMLNTHLLGLLIKSKANFDHDKLSADIETLFTLIVQSAPVGIVIK